MSEAHKLEDEARLASKPVVLRVARRAHLRVISQAEAPDPDRPKTRGDCKDGPRPCPWVSCRYHLYLDVNESTGSIKLNQPHLEPDELEHSCALDIADAGGTTLKGIGDLLGVTRERARQIVEDEAFEAFRDARWGLGEFDWRNDE